MSSLNNELAKVGKSAGLSGFAEVSGYGLSFLGTTLIARIAGAEIYGTVAIAIAVVSYFRIFALLGLDKGLLKYISFYHGKNEVELIQNLSISAFTLVSLSASLLVVCYFLIFDGWINKFYFEVDNLSYAINILIFSLPFVAVAGIWATILGGFQEAYFRPLAQKVIQPLGRLIFIIPLFFVLPKLIAVIGGTFASYLLTFFFLFHFVKHKVSFSSTEKYPDWSSSKDMLLFSLPLLTLGVMTLVANNSAVLLVGHFLDAKNAGVFAISRKLSKFLTIPLISLGGILAPTVSKLYAKNEKDQIQIIYHISTKWAYVLGGLGSVIFLTLSRSLLLIFGKEFTMGVQVLPILALGYLIHIAVGPIDNLLLMLGYSRYVILNSVVGGLLFILLNCFLIPLYGLMGAALGSSISIILLNMIRIIEVRYFLGMMPYEGKSSFFRLTLVIILSSFFMFFFRSLINIPYNILYLTVNSLLAIGVFSFLFFTLIKITPEDKQLLKSVYRLIH